MQCTWYQSQSPTTSLIIKDGVLTESIKPSDWFQIKVFTGGKAREKRERARFNFFKCRTFIHHPVVNYIPFLFKNVLLATFFRHLHYLCSQEVEPPSIIISQWLSLQWFVYKLHLRCSSRHEFSQVLFGQSPLSERKEWRARYRFI